MLPTMCSVIQLLEYAELFWATEPSLAMLCCNARPAIFAWWTPEVQFHDHLLTISWILPKMQRMPSSVYKHVLAFIELYYTYWFVCHSPYLIVMSLGGRGLVSSAFLFQGLEQCLVHSRHTNDWMNEWHAIYPIAQNLLVFTRLCSFK